MKLKEVKKHFENAKTVKHFDYGPQEISEPFYKRKGNIFDAYGWSLWHKDIGFAEIITYKTLTGIKKAILDDYNKLFPVDNIEKEFITEEFKYLEKVIVSDQEDFSRYHECRYACKHTLKGHVVFTQHDSVFVFKYIKKIK